jgi:hypothetical protein
VLLADHVDGQLDEVADHRLDVAPDVADLGELRRLDLDEGRLGEPGKAAGDLGLADAGRADEDDVGRLDLLADVLVDAPAPPAVAQRDRDGALGPRLADDELVELGDDLARGELGDLAALLGVDRLARRRAAAGHPRLRPLAARVRPPGRVATLHDSASVSISRFV